jgi:iron complex outermembrane receptor protein
MKKILILLFLIAYQVASGQSFTLSGNVLDEDKNPLIGATILVKETQRGTSTDYNGEFLINLPKGIYHLQVSYIGFKTAFKEISFLKNGEIEFILPADATVLDEVLVSAIRVNADAPVSFSNLTKKDIEQRNLGQDIPVLLNYLPSVISSSDAGAGIGYTYMSVRGSNGERINVTINGIPYNDAESHGSFWVNLGDFASSTESLQLQRGVGTSTNGSGAFGASLNILTDAISQESNAEISNSFGSFGTRKHTVKFSTGKMNNHIEIAGRLSNIYSDGYVDRSSANLKSYYLQGSYTDGNTLIKAITFGGTEKTDQAWEGLTADQLAEDRRQNPYTYDNQVDDYKQDHYQLHWNEKISKNWSTNVGLNYTKGSGFFEQYKADKDVAEFGGIVTATNGDGGTDLIVRRWLDNDFYVVNFSTEYQNDRLKIINGISYSNYTGDHFGEVIWAKQFTENATIRDRYYFSDAQKTDFSVFSKTTYNFTKKWIGYLDIQGRFVNYQTAGITSDIVPIDVDASFGFFNPKVGLTYKINSENNLYTSFAVANREPNRNDFENGVSTNETLYDFELGWRLKTESIKLNTNIYYMNYKNQLVLTGALDDVGAPVRATSGDSYRLGLEVDADLRISEKFSVKPNATFSQNQNQNFFSTLNGSLQNLGNTPISFSPNLIIGNRFVYQPKENVQLSFLSKYVSKQFMSNLESAVSTNDVLDAYFTSDFNVFYEIKTNAIVESIVFSGLINNIFNVKYVDRGYYYTYSYEDNGSTVTEDGAGYYPQATTNFLVGVTVKF